MRSYLIRTPCFKALPARFAPRVPALCAYALRVKGTNLFLLSINEFRGLHPFTILTTESLVYGLSLVKHFLPSSVLITAVNPRRFVVTSKPICPTWSSNNSILSTFLTFFLHLTNYLFLKRKSIVIYTTVC